jgi:PAS domain S-box-containing protein
MRTSAPLTELSSPAARDIAREYEELVNNLDDVVFRFDRHGRWNYLSPAWLRWLGWDPGECLGCAAAKYVHRDDRSEVLRNWQAVLLGHQNSYRHEVRFHKARGGTRWMLVSARSLRDPEGTLRGVTGTLTDITAAKAAEDELIAARTAAEAANKSKSEFLSTMSHELRTPLNAVIGLSESLLELGSSFEPERARRYLGIIHQSGRQLLAQINDILDLARIEAGRLTLNPEPFDLRTLCTQAIELSQRDLQARQIEAKIFRPPAPVIVNADERLLRQVLQNLVSNAVKFTEIRGRIVVSLRQKVDGATTLEVADTGIGIPAEKIPLLFRPFSQVDASLSRPFGGTGLGLVLVERIVRLHGGRVTVQSMPARGSTFTVELPAHLARASVPRDPLATRSNRILLVDDDPHQHTLVGDYLRHRGFEVVHCESGPSALAEIDSHEPGLALIDIHMPGVSGLELVAQLRQTPHGRNLPIIAVTALAEAEEAERCRAAGANAHLAKPISLTALKERIEHFTGFRP